MHFYTYSLQLTNVLHTYMQYSGMYSTVCVYVYTYIHTYTEVHFFVCNIYTSVCVWEGGLPDKANVHMYLLNNILCLTISC